MLRPTLSACLVKAGVTRRQFLTAPKSVSLTEGRSGSSTVSDEYESSSSTTTPKS